MESAIDYQILAAVLAGIVLLLFLILVLRIQAFVALLIASISVGIIAGMAPADIIGTMKIGMGNTLGFVAVVVGLGAMFGAMLEHSGGANALANFLLRVFGDRNASWALMITGFLVAIPVFFDVAFIILVPIIYALQRRSGKSLLMYAIPLLAGLAITHAFIPPTPGPVAVADILGADLGWVILAGFLVGIPTAILSGPLFGRFISGKIHLEAPELEESPNEGRDLPSVGMILGIIAVPIVLILCNTMLDAFIEVPEGTEPGALQQWMSLIGHPFVALIIANLLAWYLLGIQKGLDKKQLLDITTRSMGPAGIIILLTGAGGVFKQMLVDTGAGNMMAKAITEAGLGILFFAFIAAVLIRVLQGSATVAMITAAGLVAPLMSNTINPWDTALLVIAIASGASILSHVNDSGFWLVNKYLGMDEKQTFRSWSMMTTILAFTGFVSVLILSLLS